VTKSNWTTIQPISPSKKAPTSVVYVSVFSPEVFAAAPMPPPFGSPVIKDTKYKDYSQMIWGLVD